MIKVSKGLERYQEENPFAMSIGDLMAALLLIFVLLLSSTLLRIQEEAEKGRDIQKALYRDLVDKFSDRQKDWNMVIDTTLTISFKEPDVLFQPGRADLQPRFMKILNEFFPQYIEVLRRAEHVANIDEIRIEGHTSSDWTFGNVDTATAFLKNMELSQGRTRTVLTFSLSTLQETADLEKKWVRSKLAAIGFSSSRLIAPNNIEDKIASRRVEFKVRTDSDKRIKELIGR
ncbi:MAG: OmpA family protein [Ignavibacteriales bacterium]|nr:OmpA family protein [Ignavibacteriales bacterium]